MAITFVDEVSGTVTNGGTVTLDLSAGLTGLAENDIVFAWGVGSRGTPASPSGYTEIENDLDTTNRLSWALSYKVQTSSLDTSISFWDTGDLSDSGTGGALAFRGVDTTTPLDVAIVVNHTTVDSRPSFSPITPASDDCCIVLFGGGDVNDSSIGGISNYTNAAVNTSNDDNDTTLGTAYRILTGNGGVQQTPGTFSTWSTLEQCAIAITVALRPASTGQPFALRDSGVPFIGTVFGQGQVLSRVAMSNIVRPRRKLLLPTKPTLRWV